MVKLSWSPVWKVHHIFCRVYRKVSEGNKLWWMDSGCIFQTKLIQLWIGDIVSTQEDLRSCQTIQTLIYLSPSLAFIFKSLENISLNNSTNLNFYSWCYACLCIFISQFGDILLWKLSWSCSSFISCSYSPASKKIYLCIFCLCI